MHYHRVLLFSLCNLLIHWTDHLFSMLEKEKLSLKEVKLFPNILCFKAVEFYYRHLGKCLLTIPWLNWSNEKHGLIWKAIMSLQAVSTPGTNPQVMN